MDAADAAAPTAPPGVAAPAAPAEGRRRLDPRLRKVLQVVISLAIVVGIFWYVLGQFADISEVWDAMRTLTWREVVVLVVAATWNLAPTGS